MPPFPTPSPSFQKAIGSLVLLLDKDSFPYAFMGGIAVQAWGATRLTHDIDVIVFVNREDAENLLKQVAKARFHPTPISKRPLGNFALSRFIYSDEVKLVDITIDILTSEGEFQRASIERALIVNYFGTDIKIITPEDLIIYKALSDRIIDRVDIENIVEEQKGKLDKKYITLWAKRFKIHNALKKRHPKLII